MSQLAKLGSKFPTIGALNANAAKRLANVKPCPGVANCAGQCACQDLKMAVWDARLAYYTHKMNNMGARWGRAKEEWTVAKDVWSKGIGEISGKQAGVLALYGVELAGFFVVGEMIGRGCITGYPAV